MWRISWSVGLCAGLRLSIVLMRALVPGLQLEVTGV